MIEQYMANGEDVSEKTSIVSSDTFSGKMQDAQNTPPAIVVLMGPPGYMGKQWALTNSEYIIGRNIDCPIFVDDKSVSRNHARVNIVGFEVIIQDLNSSNKTSINGVELAPNTPTKLKNNDQIKVGNVVMKFLERGNLEVITTKQMSEKAEKDGLTGIYNKGALLEKGPEAIRRSDVLGESLSVLIFDIDFFKKINDTYGHTAGDYVIKNLATIVNSKLIRSNDYFARYGGEEFVLILNGTPMKNATDIAERIRLTIESTDFVFNGTQIPVRISIGVATRKENENDWAAFLDRADAALYQSKQGGRNRVTVSQG